MIARLAEFLAKRFAPAHTPRQPRETPILARPTSAIGITRAARSSTHDSSLYS
jgi:hypothetical protein